jgi:hypothetical protein
MLLGFGLFSTGNDLTNKTNASKSKKTIGITKQINDMPSIATAPIIAPTMKYMSGCVATINLSRLSIYFCFAF